MTRQLKDAPERLFHTDHIDKGHGQLQVSNHAEVLYQIIYHFDSVQERQGRGLFSLEGDRCTT